MPDTITAEELDELARIMRLSRETVPTPEVLESAASTIRSLTERLAKAEKRSIPPGAWERMTSAFVTQDPRDFAVEWGPIHKENCRTNAVYGLSVRMIARITTEAMAAADEAAIRAADAAKEGTDDL